MSVQLSDYHNLGSDRHRVTVAETRAGLIVGDRDGIGPATVSPRHLELCPGGRATVITHGDIVGWTDSEHNIEFLWPFYMMTPSPEFAPHGLAPSSSGMVAGQRLLVPYVARDIPGLDPEIAAGAVMMGFGGVVASTF